MSVKWIRIAGLLLGLGIIFGSLRAAPREGGRKFLIQVGAGAEYFARSLAWDNDTGASTLSTGLGLIRLGVAFDKGPSLALLAGYGLSDWNGLVFRKLPFSEVYRAGSIGSPVFGAEADVPLTASGAWTFGMGGRILFCLGSSKAWTLSGLGETGSLDGKGVWTRIRFGPTVAHRGFEAISPFAAVYYDGLWGTFTINEEIGILSGKEEKKIRGQGVLGLSLGLLFDPSSSFRLKAEGSLVPYAKLEGGLNLKAGILLEARFQF